jgi:S-adenosylmethionine:tRNA ribosyltransferase-isomerase
MRTADFNYFLPDELIAQYPAPERDSSRLLVLDRLSGRAESKQFADLPDYFQAGDLLVLNNSKVIPARLRAFKEVGGGAIEVLLVEEVEPNDWWVMLRPGKRVRSGTLLRFNDLNGKTTEITAEVVEKNEEGRYRIRFKGVHQIIDELPEVGELPLPPYIQRPGGLAPADTERYQTVFARENGSIAAPTAGLHFTPSLLGKLRSRGVEITEVTLHVGIGTFAPVKAENLEQHKMHCEKYEITATAAAALHAAKSRKNTGARIFAAGTTALRVLESAVNASGDIAAGRGETRLFVYPPYEFKVVDALITNFHLPESTLLMLVSAFAAPRRTSGTELILKAYAEAVRQRYRFFSYGDAMLIL